MCGHKIFFSTVFVSFSGSGLLLLCFHCLLAFSSYIYYFQFSPTDFDYYYIILFPPKWSNGVQQCELVFMVVLCSVCSNGKTSRQQHKHRKCLGSKWKIMKWTNGISLGPLWRLSSPPQSSRPQLLLYLVSYHSLWPSPQSLEHIMRPLFLWLLVTLQNPNIARKQNIKHSRRWLRRPTKKSTSFFFSYRFLYYRVYEY